MRMQMECRILTSKNLAKLKQYHYLHAEFLEEAQYLIAINVHGYLLYYGFITVSLRAHFSY